MTFRVKQERQPAEMFDFSPRSGQHVLFEKMLAVSGFAAGVAREANNPLAYVTANVNTLEGYITRLLSVLDAYGEAALVDADQAAGIESLKEAAELDHIRSDAMELLRETREGVQCISGIVRHLSVFSRTCGTEWQRVDLNACLDEIVEQLCHGGEQAAVRVVRDYGSLPAVECARDDMEVVFRGLLQNAMQAVRGDGTVTLRTGCRDGEYVWTEFSDTGDGIAEEHLDRIFEPFFTTRPVGEGAGLGLPLACCILWHHGGTVDVAASAGAGATFTVYLPLRQYETAGMRPQTSAR